MEQAGCHTSVMRLKHCFNTKRTHDIPREACDSMTQGHTSGSLVSHFGDETYAWSEANLYSNFDDFVARLEHDAPCRSPRREGGSEAAMVRPRSCSGSRSPRGARFASARIPPRPGHTGILRAS